MRRLAPERHLIAGFAVLACLFAPAAARAGSYGWNMPAEFSVAGANPDHDTYGGTPWVYADGSAASSLAPLDTFQAKIDGGLAGWSDSHDSAALVGVNPQSTPIAGGNNNEDTFPPGRMVLEPTQNHLVALRWTSPLQGTVSLAGTIVSDETDSRAAAACAALGWDTWSLDLNGAAVQGESGTVPPSTQSAQAVAASVPVSPGDTIDLVVTAGAGTSADPGCAPVGVTLALQTPASVPAPVLAGPGAGTSIDDGEPTFSGTASTAFGDRPEVTVRVYQGSVVDSASLTETLAADLTGGSFSVAPSPFLYDGTYTVQVEQDNIVGDQGFSSPVSFQVADPLPPITLASLGARPLSTGAPVLSGTAGTIDGDSPQIAVYIWRGPHARGYPVRRLVAIRAGGSWQIAVEPALPDGPYVAIAAQNGPAGLIGSQLVFFEVDAHPPVVTVLRPAAGARASATGLVIAGRASAAADDFRWVEVLLYRGASATGRPVGAMKVVAEGGRWAVRWPRRLRAGTYTVRVGQRDAAGGVGLSAPKTFVVRAGRRRRR
jgi:hypothetical protein